MSNSLDRVLMRTFWLVSVMLSCWMLSSPTWAGERAQCDITVSGTSAQRFGIIARVKGEVAAKSILAGTSRNLQEGSLVYVGEKISASATGEAVIKTDDAGYVAVRPNTEFIAKRFVAQGKKTDSMTLELLTGSLRVITGWIGKLNPTEHRVITPSATIGIRGTDHEPFVLPADLATSTQYKAGTYDKVNRGKTALGAGDQSLEIEAGRVGFSRKTQFQTKSLMTILMPVLLDKVPDFYVAGQFDSELDQISKIADEDSAKQLAQKLKSDEAAAPNEPKEIANKWLKEFDNAVVKRDAPAILALFSPDVVVSATVRSKNGKLTTIEFDREELAQSTIAAAKGLKDFSQRRISVEAETANMGNTCDQITVRSTVIEQGEQSGKRYRLVSREEYLLKLRDGKWLAIKAKTTQR